MTQPLVATYRLQLHGGFTFADALEQVPYLAELGVSHLYLSPVLQAVPGSTHGYDVLDHTRVNEELGGRDGLERLADLAHGHGLGIVVDVVPNHMAVVAPEHSNAPLWKVLRGGPGADAAVWFDVDWQALGGRIGIPVLGDDAEAVSADLTVESWDGEPVVRYHDHVFPVAAGTEKGSALDVLGRQHYALTSWRSVADTLNYRRFFDVTSLIAVRVEVPEVFEATHSLLLDLHRGHVVDGFRIDHPDGLADPEGYLERLRDSLRHGTPVWVEKILEGGEELPASFACSGTTGYDAARAISLALVDASATPVLDATWAAAGGGPGVEEMADSAKRQVVREGLAAEVHRLTRRAAEALPALDEERLAQAVVELLVAGEVYRAYVRPGTPLTHTARSRLEEAGARAAAARPDLTAELERLTGLAEGGSGGDAGVDFAVRLQQTWGPVMAKGIEDTTFYRHFRLVALNEVGGDPGRLADASVEDLHTWARRQAADWPRGMTTLSTHDTKRSEDVRARLLAVAADQDTWQRCSAAFAAAADDAGVDRPTAHLLWQTLVGVGDISRERLHGYLTKALREAKVHTSWTETDADYERRVLDLADAATSAGSLHQAVLDAVSANADAIRALVLGQKLVQLMLPGVPDVYQGTEMLDLSLVDPDNRRPVDFAQRRARLTALQERAPRDLDEEKLLVTSRALTLRGQLPDVFGPAGSYEPLAVEGLVGFVRGGKVAVLAPRAASAARAARAVTVALPPGTWTDELTGATRSGEVQSAALFERLPVALLVRRG